MDKKYHLCWGTLTVADNYFMINEDSSNGKYLFDLLPDCYMTEGGGKFGLYDKDGIVFPNVFDQVERVGQAWFCRLGDRYCFLKFYGGISTLSSALDPDGDIFVENGKVGWKSSERVYIPALFEEVGSLGRNEIFWGLTDGKYKYLNNHAEEVLTNVRPVEPESTEPRLLQYLDLYEAKAIFTKTYDDEQKNGEWIRTTIKYNNAERMKEAPFCFRGSKKNSITSFEFVGQPDANDSNVVKLLDNWIRIDRHSKSEIRKLLLDPADDLPISDWSLRDFDSNLATEFAAFIVHGQGEHPLKECVDQLCEMPTFVNTWYFLIKIWLAPDEKLGAEELRWLRYDIEDTPSNAYNEVVYCVGHDEKLRSGEVRMLVVTHFMEEYFNTPDYLDWGRDRFSLPVKDIRYKMDELDLSISSAIPSEYQEDVWQRSFTDCITGIIYNSSLRWEDSVEVLNYFKKIGCPYRSIVMDAMKKIRCNLEFHNDLTESDVRENDFLYFVIVWGLENGADVNWLSNNKKTSIDMLDDILEKGEDLSEAKLQTINKLKPLLIEHGGLSKAELRKQESTNTDYFVELRRMNKDDGGRSIPRV